MAILEQRRDQINDKYKWDLSLIYSDEDNWKKDYSLVESMILKFNNYKGRIMISSDTLYEVVNLSSDVSRKLEKLYMYAHLNYDSDTSVNKYQTMVGKIQNLYKKYEEETTFIGPEILKSSYSKIKDYYNEIEDLKKYDNYFKEIFRYKKHTLTIKEEKILSSMSNIFNVPSKTYDFLTDTDMKLGFIKDEEGNEIELTDSNYSKYISSKDREVRKEAFNKMHEGYKQFINTMASTLYGEVDGNVTVSKLRHYDSAIGMTLYGDNVNVSVYDNLIDTVSKNLDKLFKYYSLRKNVLKLDEIHLYDLYNNLINNSDKDYSFDEAKEMVINSLNVLGDDYINNLKKAFDDKWIDIYSNAGKRSGAYSSGGYDTNPYILLNYQGKLKDVSTLAHELGHSLHSYYSVKNNNYQDYHYAIFVAEVASTVNELLLCKYMLKKSVDKDEKLTILNKLLELFKGTIYRQTMFAEYEKIIYEKCENGEILTQELLSELYYDINKKYFGNDFVVDEPIRYEWARIPHFYYFFYVYKYATGLAAACYIVNNILNGEEGYTEKYLEFLKSGSQNYPIELLRIADVDMNDPKVVESAIQMFDETIDEFVRIYNS
ncbi:MAG: oligoendopeptidase F [Ignavibacteriales bacterium]